MAINTKARRASVQAYTLGLMRPPPDGSVNTADKATVAWLYAGLSYGPLDLEREIYSFSALRNWFQVR